jgi:UDP-glucose 4-epimerase
MDLLIVMRINSFTMKPKVLVVGGAGYIGSHMVLRLLQAGFQPLILDKVRPRFSVCEAIQGDMADKTVLHDVFSTHSFCAVMHFAAYIDVAESALFPAKYYQNNVAATLHLLEVMSQHQIKYFIFSSTAAVYGEPKTARIAESHPCLPVNVYGRTKWMMEQIIQDIASNGTLNYAILRYFNAAGADAKGRAGECHEPETHLIPLLLQAAVSKKKSITIHGDHYPTIDGTCVRDYIHVMDLCEGHLLALHALLAGCGSLIYNLGTGEGHSVLQVIEAVEHVTGCSIARVNGKPREGDPAILVADASLAHSELKWTPHYSELYTIISHAWQFMQRHSVDWVQACK